MILWRSDQKITRYDADYFRKDPNFRQGLWVDIFARKMQEDFEGILERRIHYFANYGRQLA